jgi:ATP-dependent 26S proteasome regulatory subunit
VATVPQWFRERNTVLHGVEGQAVAQPRQQVEIRRVETEAKKAKGLAQSQGGDGGNPLPSETQGDTGHRYVLSEALWEELCASAKAGLRLPPAKYAKEPSAQKSHLVLQYPGADGILFLDAVVKRLAQELGADVVTLDAQDIAQLCSEQDMADSGATSPIRSLGYEVYRPSIAESWQEMGDNLNEEADDDFIDSPVPPRNFRPGLKGGKFITISSASNSGDIPLPSILGLKSLMTSFNGPLDGTAAAQSPSDRVEDRRLRLVHELISSPSRRSQPGAETESSESQPAAVRDVIVQVQDYGEIQATREGAKFITLLQKAIMDRRKAGTRVLFIGTSAQEISPESDSARLMQNAFDDHFSQMLVITPGMESKVVEKTFTEDRKRRTLDINIRHMQDMLRTRLDGSSAVKDAVLGNRSWPLPPSLVKESGLDERYWPYSQIHWATTLALGSVDPNEPLGFEHIQRGIEMMHKTDQTKNDWLQERTPKSTLETSTDRERLLNSLRKTCNSHEKKLLNGVVDASNIRTTFADVHVPPETIDALKTLTSLSLIRPEAFTYGVLATDKIPGLLLYGPPGTGKTLLAKAVARESGATVLEVSGSEVYDMYVGEGEKNVKAIFTLAKKLSPCVVFIDEADAIFCSRTGASSRTSHRELINQFLREWDGMNDMSAFIMVATNRPFDLDDAVLRRLPRRLLVDLPTEQDRLAILKIHLKEETLDPSVDLAELAHRTPLYSGSDLKNLCVAAALACVREENDLAAKHQGPEPYQYPARRILSRAHFERGMEEISASISEDMSSLSAIRKFDEQYGDRKGRRKKSAGWGFTPLGAEQTETDAARVRT